MTQSRLYLLATQLEAKPILEDQRFQWQKTSNDALQTCANTGDSLLITDIGPTRSAYNVGRVAESFRDSLWINLGVAGALNDLLEVGQMRCVGQVEAQYEAHPFDRSSDKIELKQEGWKCLSLGEALHDEKKKAELKLRGDIVDMELFSLALAAKFTGVRLESHKIISDFSSEKDAKLIVKRIPELMAQLWKSWSSETP